MEQVNNRTSMIHGNLDVEQRGRSNEAGNNNKAIEENNRTRTVQARRTKLSRLCSLHNERGSSQSATTSAFFVRNCFKMCKIMLVPRPAPPLHKA